MNRINETKYNSLFGYCFEKKNICYKTIHINSDQYFVGNDLKYLQNFKKVFDKSFIECEKLGSGGFGEVFKVKDKFNLDFAVKKIYLNGKNTSDSYMRAIPRETTSPQENQELCGVKSRTFPGQVYYRIKTGVALWGSPFTP